MIGQLRHRIGLYAPSAVADDIGGTITRWSFQRAVWAVVQPQRITETEDHGRPRVVQSFRVVMRYRDDVHHRARIHWRGRTLRVLAVSDPDTRFERLHLICEEVLS